MHAVCSMCVYLDGINISNPVTVRYRVWNTRVSKSLCRCASSWCWTCCPRSLRQHVQLVPLKPGAFKTKFNSICGPPRILEFLRLKSPIDSTRRWDSEPQWNSLSCCLVRGWQFSMDLVHSGLGLSNGIIRKWSPTGVSAIVCSNSLFKKIKFLGTGISADVYHCSGIIENF